MRQRNTPPTCKFCHEPSKYTCPACTAAYCSLGCYKSHKLDRCAPSASSDRMDSSSTSINTTNEEAVVVHPADDAPLVEPGVLKPLTSVRWPYIPEEPSYPDPFMEAGPKPLQLKQYEAIATSREIRDVLASNERLREIMRTVDALKGSQRETELEKLLGVATVGTTEEYDLRDSEYIRELANIIDQATGGKDEVSAGLERLIEGT